jgi:hypothetical protein
MQKSLRIKLAIPTARENPVQIFKRLASHPHHQAKKNQAKTCGGLGSDVLE